MFDDPDPHKEAINKDKHGIYFKEAQRLWAYIYLLIASAKETKGEIRYLNVGQIEGKYWTAITTMRGDLIRIISVRRARNKEIEAYESRRTR
jgi:uncharacterized DUF497 family protein